VLYRYKFFELPGITEAYFNANPSQGNKLYFFFLPHIVPFVSGTAPLLHHTWTIGIEEQLYLGWGILFFFVKKSVRPFLLWILFVLVLFNFIHSFIYNFSLDSPGNRQVKFISQAITYLKYSRITTFAIGSLAGYAYYLHKSWLSWFENKIVQVLIYLVIILSVITGIEIPYIQFEYMAVLMTALILIAVNKETSIVNFNIPWMMRLGRVSYSTYLFHIIAIVICARLLGFTGMNKNSLLTQLILIVSALLVSNIFGLLLYECFEKHFLKLKSAFKKVS
jgi:peptidoglycan/LPS O-acetylase OafA/YrhL